MNGVPHAFDNVVHLNMTDFLVMALPDFLPERSLCW